MTRHRRRGTAPLELALVLPLLFAIVYAGWWCVRCGLTKTTAATDARRTTWEKREEADPGVPFDLAQKPLVSVVESEIESPVPGRNPFSRQTVNAISSSAMTDKTWQFLQFGFPELRESPISAHQKQLLHFGQFIPFIEKHGPSVSGFKAMDLLANPLFNKYIVPARLFRIARRLAVRLFYDPSRAAMVPAEAECHSLASAFPLAAAYYEGLAVIIAAGIPAAQELKADLKK